MSDVISDFFDRDALISLYKAQGWTSAEFARQAGLNKNMISRYERGLSTPRPAYIVRLAETLGVEPATLYRVEEYDKDLSYFRIINGYSIAALSVKLGMKSNNSVVSMEMGNTELSPQMRRSLSEIFGISEAKVRQAWQRSREYTLNRDLRRKAS
ncbi:helix-turn-helix domain-containing protein [Tsukamurella hominis]|uniref:helix-turn-helix domain-containing protein n=1 Tax=Tsukamurella hominis TaxID=1970232 RepID=UPI0039E767DD